MSERQEITAEDCAKTFKIALRTVKTYVSVNGMWRSYDRSTGVYLVDLNEFTALMDRIRQPIHRERRKTGPILVKLELDEELWKRVDISARHAGVTSHELIRVAVRSHLMREERLKTIRTAAARVAT